MYFSKKKLPQKFGSYYFCLYLCIRFRPIFWLWVFEERDLWVFYIDRVVVQEANGPAFFCWGCLGRRNEPSFRCVFLHIFWRCFQPGTFSDERPVTESAACIWCRQFRFIPVRLLFSMPRRYLFYNEEFDPGSGWTLATGLTHASRGAAWT